MPMTWTSPEEVVWHEKPDETFLIVYRSYKDGNADEPHTHWFRVDEAELDNDFDIRFWVGYDPERTPKENVEAAVAQRHIVSMPDGMVVATGFCGLLKEHTRPESPPRAQQILTRLQALAGDDDVLPEYLGFLVEHAQECEAAELSTQGFEAQIEYLLADVGMGQEDLVSQIEGMLKEHRLGRAAG